LNGHAILEVKYLTSSRRLVSQRHSIYNV